jgi:hypothetical protein
MTMWADVGRLLDGAMAPIFGMMAPIDPLWQGAILGLPVALLALVIYRHVSNQSEITRTKTGIKAQLLALRLFRDDLRVVLQAQVRVFSLIGRYLLLALVPMAILIVPVLLLIMQVEARFAFSPLKLEEPALLTVVLAAPATPSRISAQLYVPADVRAETPSLRLDSERKLVWRIRPTMPGEHLVDVKIDNQAVQKRLWAGDVRPRLLVPTVYRGDDIRALANASEALGAHSIVSSVSIDYSDDDGRFAGLSPASWSMVVSSLLFGFALRRPLGVDF